MKANEVVNSLDDPSNKSIICETVSVAISNNVIDSMDSLENIAERMAFRNTFLKENGTFCDDILLCNDITDYDKLFSYYEKRAHEVSHPLLKIVYLGMLWEFKKKYTNQEMSFCLKKEYILLICKYIDEDYLPCKNAEPKWVIRAIDLAIRTGNQELIDRVKQTTIRYIDDVNEGTLLAIVLDKITENRKFFENEIDHILEKAERLFKTLSETEGREFLSTQSLTKSLCKYYNSQSQSNRAKLKKSIDNFFNYCKNKLIDSSSFEFKKAIELYKTYDFYNDYKKRMTELEIIQREEFQKCQSIPIDIPIIPDNNYEEQKNKSWEDNLDYILTNLIPDIDAIKEEMKVSTKYSVLTSMIPKAMQSPDSSGRTEGRIGGIDDDKNGNKLYWFDFQVHYNYGSLKQIIDMFKEKLSKETLLRFLLNSYTFQDIDKQILEKIIDSLLEKEYFVFIHLIIPQIESAFRNIMIHNGHTTYAKLEKGTETLELLDEILNEEFIKSFLGENTQKFIRIILTDRRFLNIRNAVCHGYFPYELFNEQNSDLLMLISLILAQKTQL